MKKKPLVLFGLSLVLLLAVNSMVFLHVRSNRAGEPDALVILTERELQLPYGRSRDDNGLSLQLIWRTYSSEEMYYYSQHGSPGWLDKEKLRSLGFETEQFEKDKENNFRRPRPLPRDVLIVLESDSELHDKVIAMREQAVRKARSELDRDRENKGLQRTLENSERELTAEENGRSRLYVVDAGLDGKRLRAKYNDPQKYIITPGRVRMHYSGNNKGIQGWIAGLEVENIHVPLAMKRQLEAIAKTGRGYGSDTEPPRFKAKLAYGQKFEPWLVEVKEIQ